MTPEARRRWERIAIAVCSEQGLRRAAVHFVSSTMTVTVSTAGFGTSRGVIDLSHICDTKAKTLIREWAALNAKVVAEYAK